MRRKAGARPLRHAISLPAKRVIALKADPEKAMPQKLTRRTLLRTAAAAAGASAISAPFVSGAYAAGKLSCGFWDHWVPTALDPMRKICQEWADKKKVDLRTDFFPS